MAAERLTAPPAPAFLGKIDLKQAKKRADKGDRKDPERYERLGKLLSDMEASL
jgi:hypothetical protein